MRMFSGRRLRALLLGVPVAAALSGALGLGWGQAAAPAQADDPPQVTVNITNFAFAPTPLTITAGTIVTWVQNDASRHSATDANGAFDTGLLPQGGSASVEFDFPGVYTYSCSIHPFMHGEIDVADATAVAQTSQQTPQ